MFKKTCLLIFPVLLFISTLSAVSAATVITIQDENTLSTMTTDGRQARIDMSADEYVIVDFSKQKVKMVNPQKNQVMVFNVNNKADQSRYSAPAQIKLSLVKKGGTKSIAGYSSDRYEYSANGRSCGVIYASNDALQVKGVQQLLDAMQAMIEQQQAVMGGFMAMMDDCKLADMQLTDKIKNIGVPMQKEENGRVTTQVKSIHADVALPSDIFNIPSSYQTTSLDQQIQKADKGNAAQQRPQSQPQPQLQDMIKQMQQSGQLTPEMIQQMQRAQGMMQQYQRQGY